MNYRHAFHAGNFADVVKHAVLVRMLVHLRRKPAAFRVIDTHAGAGRYDLLGPEAARSGEWREGIGRLLAAPLAEPARELLAPYLDAVAALNPASFPGAKSPGALSAYPGSPALVRAFLRPQDRLIACELEPNAATALGRYLHWDRRSKAVAIDGWTALNAYVPPPERRGLVLIDPPFEDAGDFPRLAHDLAAAHQKWASGSYLGIAKMLRLELDVAAPARRPGPPGDAAAPGALAACGLIVVNPPWTLAEELQILLPALAAAMSGGAGGAHRVDWLTTEK
jgi:23S rRNA (adenine2030-N6)-methyltransferase